MKKVGIIRCQQTCPGTTDFTIASNGILAFDIVCNPLFCVPQQLHTKDIFRRSGGGEIEPFG